MWITGLRNGSFYKISKRPLDPRWSEKDTQVMLGLCANALSLGWTEDRAVRVAEAIVMRSKYNLTWSQDSLNRDMDFLVSKTL